MANITGALNTISSDLQAISDKLQQINISSLDPAEQLPKEAGVAAVGTSTKYAREDHVHPAQEVTPLEHTHEIADVNNLQARIDAINTSIDQLIADLSAETARATAEEDKINKANAADIQKAVTDINKLNDADIKAAKSEIYAEFDKVVDGTTKVKKAEFADMLTTERTISLSGDVAGSVKFGGEKDVDIVTTVKQLDHPIKIKAYKNAAPIGDWEIDSANGANNYVDLDNSIFLKYEEDRTCWIRAVTIESDGNIPEGDHVFDLIISFGTDYRKYKIKLSCQSGVIYSMKVYFLYGSDFDYSGAILGGTYTNKVATLWVRGDFWCGTLLSINASYSEGNFKCTLKNSLDVGSEDIIGQTNITAIEEGYNYTNQMVPSTVMFEKGLFITARSYDCENFVGMTYDDSIKDDSIGGKLKFSINWNSGKAPILSNVADPIEALDVSNKQYVDNAIQILEGKLNAAVASINTQLTALKLELNPPTPTDNPGGSVLG